MNLRILITVIFLLNGILLVLHSELIDGIAATVNGEVISFSQIHELVGTQEKVALDTLHGETLQKRLKEIRLAAIHDLVDRELIIQSFKKKKFTIPDYIVNDTIQKIIRTEFSGDRIKFIKTLQAQGYTFTRFREMQRDKIIVQAMRQIKISDNIVISPLKIEEYYRKNKASYFSCASVKLHMIVLRNNQEFYDDPTVNKKLLMEQIYEKILNGANFENSAQMYSEDSTSSVGGDWGWVDTKTLNPTLSKVAFSLNAQQISSIITLDNCFYLLKVDEKKEAVLKSLRQVEVEIIQKLIEEEKIKQQEDWIEHLRQKAYIKIFNDTHSDE